MYKNSALRISTCKKELVDAHRSPFFWVVGGGVPGTLLLDTLYQPTNLELAAEGDEPAKGCSSPPQFVHLEFRSPKIPEKFEKSNIAYTCRSVSP